MRKDQLPKLNPFYLACVAWGVVGLIALIVTW